MSLHPAYFQTRFQMEHARKLETLPEPFAIVSAYATTGEQWPLERNKKQDLALESELRESGREPIRVIGYSPEGDHAEPSWLVELSLDEACEIGLRFLQDAIYFVEQGELYVVRCGLPRTMVRVDRFLARVDG